MLPCHLLIFFKQSNSLSAEVCFQARVWGSFFLLHEEEPISAWPADAGVPGFPPVRLTVREDTVQYTTLHS